MLTVLFRNVIGQPRCANLVRAPRLADHVFAECRRPKPTLAAINPAGPTTPFRWARMAAPCRGSLLTRLDRADLRDLYAERHSCTHAMTGSGRQELLLVSVHAASGLRVPEREQEAAFRDLADTIRRQEPQRRHGRTLFVGISARTRLSRE